MVVVNRAEDWLERAREAIDGLAGCVHRLAVVCVLPAGGPRYDEVEAVAALLGDAEMLASPTTGFAVLFGRPEDVAHFAVAEGYDIVVHPFDTAAFNATLEQVGIGGVGYGDADRLIFTPPDLVATV
jgi:hypothetical protein